MALYCYIKAEPKPAKTTNIFTFFSIGLAVVGIALILSVASPILFYQLSTDSLRRKILSPIGGKGQLSGVALGQSGEVDYTNLGNWYPSLPDLPPVPSRITHYTISIPALEINEAVVQIGGEDLMKSLIQYPGTALPGQYGNTIIFGHSVLPQFFNPKIYRTIFSTLPRMDKGDEIIVNFDGIVYRYLVIEMEETEPTDLGVLEQHYDSQYLTLITCVPPGVNFRRLVVKARLASI
jgi:sortase A